MGMTIDDYKRFCLKCGWIWEENKQPIKDALLSWLEAEEHEGEEYD